MGGSSAGRTRTPPGKHTGASQAAEHTARDTADARTRHILEPVRLTLDDGLRRAQPAADRRSNALTQVAARQPGGVSGDKGVVAPYHVHAPAQVVAVAARIVAGARREAALQHRGQMRPVLPDVLAAALHASGDAADTDIEPARLNVGVGGIAARMKRGGQDIRQHWAHLTAMLEGRLAPGARYDPSGYSYYLRGRVDVVRRDNAFITGDAAGLASRDLGEGIGPAIRSGLRAARAIVEGEPYRLEDVTGASVGSIARSMLGRLTRASVFSGRRPRTPGGGPAHGLRHRDQ